MSCNVGKTKKDFVIAAVATVINTILVHVCKPCKSVHDIYECFIVKGPS